MGSTGKKQTFLGWRKMILCHFKTSWVYCSATKSGNFRTKKFKSWHAKQINGSSLHTWEDLFISEFQQVSFVKLLFMERYLFFKEENQAGSPAFHTRNSTIWNRTAHSSISQIIFGSEKKYTQISPPIHGQQNHTWKHARDKAEAKDKAKEEGSQQRLGK